MNIYGYAAPVIFDGNASVFIQHDFYRICKAVCRFVYGVIDYFP